MGSGGSGGSGGRLAGAVFGGKTGLFAIESQLIVDATPEATLARAAGAKFTPVQGTRRYHYGVDLAAPAAPRTVQYTASNGLSVKAEVHHYFASFEVSLESASAGPLAFAEDFDKIYAASLEMPWAGSEKRFRGADGFLSSGVDRLDAPNGKVPGFDNLFVFGPHGIAGNTEGSLVLRDWKSLFDAFPNAVERLQVTRAPLPAAEGSFEFWNRGVAPETTLAPDTAHSFRDPGFDEPGSRVVEVRFHPPAAAHRTEVIVCGGGTSGNAASYACASLGLTTVCLERGSELGGTNTIGGVTNLWFGKKTKAFEDYYAAMEAKNDGLNA